MKRLHVGHVNLLGASKEVRELMTALLVAAQHLLKNDSRQPEGKLT